MVMNRKRNPVIRLLVSGLVSLGLTTITPIYSNTTTWQTWLTQLRQEALARGIRPEVFDRAFKNVKEPSPEVLRLDKQQPEKRLMYYDYRNSRADAYRIRMGQVEYKKYHELINKIGIEYGVDPCVMLSLWGLETSYGHYLGKFYVIQSLASLAYHPRRADFFRQQLLVALEILNQGHIDQEHFVGEWAGASGQTQFMPMTWKDYAVDYDGDGKKNIWTSYPDAFASMANFLNHIGWQTNQPSLIEVQVSDKFLSIKSKKSLIEWKQLGVKSDHWPGDLSQSARLIQPDGGPVFLALNNYDVLMRWNHSIYYAGTVDYLAKNICKK
jgi:membrane-bound lytic murein transglycosylase B